MQDGTPAATGDTGQGFDTRTATAMVGLYPCWKANEGNDDYSYLSDLYAHWSIREVRGLRGSPREYGREARPAILRLIVGKNISMVSSVRIDMQDPDMTFLIPLASFSYQGRVGKGEAWSTTLIADDQGLPFFRITPTTSAQVEVNADATTEIEVKAAASVLNALRGLTSVVSPGGALITTLNRERLQQTSNALDSALSSIWSESRGERQSSGRQLSEWYPGASFLIQLELPNFIKTSANTPRRNGQVTGNKGKPTRRWYRLTLSCPRYSIFDPRQACRTRDATTKDAQSGMISENAIAETQYLQNRITAQQVNNYMLASSKTLRQHLSDQDWYARFLRQTAADLNETSPPTPAVPPGTGTNAGTGTGNGNGQPPNAPALVSAAGTAPNQSNKSHYSAFCHSIVDTLYAVGLSALDARIGLWAAVTGSPDLVGIAPNFQRDPYCAALLPLQRSGSAESGWKFANLKAVGETGKKKPARRTVKRR